jgi:hypothetical protein
MAKQVVVFTPHFRPLRMDLNVYGDLARILKHNAPPELTKKDREYVRGLVDAEVVGALKLLELIDCYDRVTITVETEAV